MISLNFIIYEHDDGTCSAEVFESEYDTLYEASRSYCFSDCDDTKIKCIYCGGRKVEYAGWQPNMLFEFTDIAGEVIFSRQFPNWDH